MQTTAIQPAIMPAPASKPAASEFISWEDFERKYLTREDEYKYEWVDGKVEKTERGMNKTQLYLQHNLQDFFRQLLNEGKVHGDLLAEPDLFFLKNHRRADMVWMTNEQIYSLADKDAYEVPAFVIEVISTNDQMNAMKKKMVNYRNAGVKVVWHIFPEFRQVDVYSGKNLDKMKTHTGKKICSAEPALPAFALSVDAIFHKPENPRKTGIPIASGR